jgi:hypothetical protein
MTDLITDQEMAMLEACKSDDDWNAACSTIKSARGGGYPPDWFSKVVMSGLAARVVEGYGGNFSMGLKAIKKDGSTEDLLFDPVTGKRR